MKLIPGRPNVVSAQNTILVTEELYQQTSDRDLLVLLLHEVGHIFLGHLALLPFARAVPSPEDETWQGLLMLPVLPWVFALREWGLVADVSADRLVAVMKSDLNLAILGVMKQVVLTAPDSESRSNLVRFLGTAKAQADRGEEVMISSQIRTLFAAHPDAEMRIENLRSWFQADAYAGLTKRLRETAAAQKTR